MSELAAITQTLTAIKVASDLVKGLRAVDGHLREAELKMKIADLAEALADARLGILDAQEEIEALQNRVKQLEAKPDLRLKLELRHNVYYMKDPPPDRTEGPYCPACYESSETLIPVTMLPPAMRSSGNFHCPICEAVY